LVTKREGWIPGDWFVCPPSLSKTEDSIPQLLREVPKQYGA
jgi:hypothetical protein